VNPLATVVLQLRVVRWTAAVPTHAKLTLGPLLMGVPFVVLAVRPGAVELVPCLLLFVAGELLWTPASQAAAVALAPSGRRGAYIGSYGGAAALASTIGPLLALELRGAAGERTMWLALAGVAVLAACAARFVRYDAAASQLPNARSKCARGRAPITVSRSSPSSKSITVGIDKTP
jgi:hypothetical protein